MCFVRCFIPCRPDGFPGQGRKNINFSATNHLPDRSYYRKSLKNDIRMNVERNRMIMKKNIVALTVLLAALMLAPFSAHALPAKRPQPGKVSVIKGTVLELATGSPLEFVTVALADTAGRVTSGATTDSTGSYIIRIQDRSVSSMENRLVFSLVGYKERSFSFLELESSAGDGPAGEGMPSCKVEDGVMEIGPVVLWEDAQVLAGAKVSGKRPLIEHQFDRLVLNVSELAVAQTGDALDVLKSSPGVTVDNEGNIKLNGSTVAVWIDGRPSNMSGSDLEAYLKGSDGSSIEKVELISNPSSKYDAEGSGGIINIKTRKAFMKGLSGSLGTRLGMRYAPGLMDNTSLTAGMMYRTDKTNTFFHYTPVHSGFEFGADQMKLYGEDVPMREESVMSSANRYFSHNVRLGNDWYISGKDILGVIFRFSASDTRGFSPEPYSISSFYGAGTSGEKLYSTMTGEDTNRQNSSSSSLNLNYTRTFDESKNQELTLNADWYRSGNVNDRSQRNMYSFISDEASAAGVQDYGFDDRTRNILDLYSFKADYSQSLFSQTGRLEAGAKAAYSSTRNWYSRYEYDFGAQARGPQSERNDFTYDEQVYAGYVNLAKKFSDKWNAQAGVRGEYTVQDGDWLMTSDQTRRSHKDYFDFFPSAFVSYTPSQKAVLTASYSYRISRPKYWQLNPFKDYASATSYTQGNIELEPSYSHNASLTALLFGRLSLTGGYNRTANFNDIQTPLLDQSTGVMGLIYSNAGVQQIAYATASLSELPLTKWWNLTVNATYSYSRFDAYRELAEKYYGQPYSSSSHSMYAYASTTFFLPKDFKFGIDGWVNTPQSVGYFRTRIMGMLNLSLIKTLWDGKGTLALYVYDLLNTCDSDLDMYTGDVKTYSILQRQSNGGVTLAFTWRFGNGGQQRQRNVGTLDEESRM